MRGLALYLTVLLAALGESTAFLGLFIPGVGAVVAAGFWAVRGEESVWLLGAAASLGAILGFGVSFHAGRAGGPRIARWSRRAEGALDSARSFFERHGSKSVFWGHFFGPVRAFVAFAAGASGLSRRTFWIASALGGIAWGYALTLTGALASGGLTLAEARLGRGSLIVAGLVVVLYVALRIATALLALGLRLAPRASVALAAVLLRLEAWGSTSARLRFLSRAAAWSRRRISADHATGLLLTVGAAACVALALVFFALLEDVWFREPIVRVDQHVFHLLQVLRTPRGDRFFLALGRIGSGPVLAAAAVGGAGAFFVWGRRFKAMLLLGGFGLGEALIWAIKRVLAVPLPPAPFGHAGGFPSNHAFSAFALYGFLAYGVGEALPPKWRGRLYAWAGVLFVAIGASRVYLGTHWLSAVAGGYALGATWLVALVTAAQTHSLFGPNRRPAPSRAWTLSATAAAVLLVGAVWYGQVGAPEAPGAPGLPGGTGTASGPPGAASLPVETLGGRPLGRIPLLLVCSDRELFEAAVAGGWREPRPLEVATFLNGATGWAMGAGAGSDPASPVYPVFWEGRPQDVALTRPARTGRWTVRLWRADRDAPATALWGAWITWEPRTRTLVGVPLPSGSEQPSREAVENFASSLLASGRFRAAEGGPVSTLIADLAR